MSDPSLFDKLEPILRESLAHLDGKTQSESVFWVIEDESPLATIAQATDGLVPYFVEETECKLSWGYADRSKVGDFARDHVMAWGPDAVQDMVHAPPLSLIVFGATATVPQVVPTRLTPAAIAPGPNITALERATRWKGQNREMLELMWKRFPPFPNPCLIVVDRGHPRGPRFVKMFKGFFQQQTAAVYLGIITTEWKLFFERALLAHVLPLVASAKPLEEVPLIYLAHIGVEGCHTELLRRAPPSGMVRVS